MVYLDRRGNRLLVQKWKSKYHLNFFTSAEVYFNTTKFSTPNRFELSIFPKNRC